MSSVALGSDVLVGGWGLSWLLICNWWRLISVPGSLCAWVFVDLVFGWPACPICVRFVNTWSLLGRCFASAICRGIPFLSIVSHFEEAEGTLLREKMLVARRVLRRIMNSGSDWDGFTRSGRSKRTAKATPHLREAVTRRSRTL